MAKKKKEKDALSGLPKRHRANMQSRPEDPQSMPAAVSTLKKYKGTKFDQTVEVCVHLGIDPRQADQAIRGSVSLPKGIGASKRVIAFCADDVVEKALDAGATKAGGESLVEEIGLYWGLLNRPAPEAVGGAS